MIGKDSLDLHFNLLHQLVLETLVAVLGHHSSLRRSLALMAACWQVDIDRHKVRKSVLTAEIASLLIETRFLIIFLHVCAILIWLIQDH